MPPAKATAQSLTHAFFIAAKGMDGAAGLARHAGPSPRHTTKEQTWPTNF
jgi:hypothetical protein